MMEEVNVEAKNVVMVADMLTGLTHAGPSPKAIGKPSSGKHTGNSKAPLRVRAWVCQRASIESQAELTLPRDTQPR